MKAKAVIFDMDGLLIDSEPLWQEAGSETLSEFGINLTAEQYHTSTGLRTEEWIQHWFHYFDLHMAHAPQAVNTIIQKAIFKIDEKGIAFPGSDTIIPFIKSHALKVGLATSSPLSLVEVVLKNCNSKTVLMLLLLLKNFRLANLTPKYISTAQLL